MQIKLAVFDIAGTTLEDNDAVSDAFCSAFEMSGFTEVYKADVLPLMGYKKPLAIKMVLEKLATDISDELIEKIHNDFVNEMMDYYEYSPEVRSMQSAEEVFQLLKEKGVIVALNTGFSKDITTTILSRLQWQEKGLIDDFICSDEVPEGRPAPYMIQELMQRANITDASEVLKVGDTEVDVNEGKNAGCGIVIGVTTGAFTREELGKYHPDHIIDNLSQIPDLIFSN